MCSDTNVIVADFRYDIQHATPTGMCGTSWEPHRATGREPLTGFMGMTEHARHHPRRGSISVGIRVGVPQNPVRGSINISPPQPPPPPRRTAAGRGWRRSRGRFPRGCQGVAPAIWSGSLWLLAIGHSLPTPPPLSSTLRNR